MSIATADFVNGLIMWLLGIFNPQLAEAMSWGMWIADWSLWFKSTWLGGLLA